MTKPMGRIPDEFSSDGGMMLLGGRRVDDLVAEAGDTPLFVYDLAMVEARIARFRRVFPRIGLHYAMKANPYLPLLQAVVKHVDGVDVASGGELERALEAGAKRISFAGPGKRDSELRASIRAGATINLESEGEAERALRISREEGLRPRLAVRVNPGFEIKGSGMRMGGGAKPFGIDGERVPALVRRIVDAEADWQGFHIFAGSQALSADALAEALRLTVELAAALAEQTGHLPQHVNLGGGFGIPYFHGEEPLAIEAVGAALAKTLGNRPQPLQNTHFSIELGRWLVGEAGVYLTRILDRKRSHEKTFLVVDGGMHHQLAASGNFGQVVRRNYPVAIASRFSAPDEEEVSIVGCLCTPLDRIADDILMPRAEPGDIVAVFLAGAYGLTASPQAFLGRPPALEMLIQR